MFISIPFALEAPSIKELNHGLLRLTMKRHRSIPAYEVEPSIHAAQIYSYGISTYVHTYSFTKKYVIAMCTDRQS